MDHLRAHPWRSSLIAGAVLGLLAASFALAAAWHHNPHGEFHHEAGIQWAAWLPIGASWFVVVGAASALICRAVLFVVAGRSNRGAA